LHETRQEYRDFHRRRRAMVREMALAHAPEGVERVLDIGGGGDIGGVAAALRDKTGAALYGVDRGEDVQEGLRLGVHAVECDIDREPLPYEDAFFDVVLFASVIEHLYNPASVLSEIARALRPGGLLVLEAPNAVALGRRLDALAGRNPFATFNRYNAAGAKAFMEYCAVFYTPDEIAEIFGARFCAAEVRYGMHDPPVSWPKRALREAAFRLRPRLGDCFALAAFRTGS
jgi:SAM-dependent methyltransferase